MKQENLIILDDEQKSGPGIMEKIENRRRKRKTRKTITITVLLTVILVVVIMMSPLFNLKYVHIEGNEKLSYDDIYAASNIVYNKNIFKIPVSGTERVIESLPYIESASLKRRYPGTIMISVTECVPVACLQYLDGKLIIDKRAKILEVYSGEEESLLPVIHGIEITEADAGKTVAASDIDKLNTAVEILNNIYSIDMQADLHYIDIEDISLIKLKVRQVHVNVGDSSQLAYKMKYLKGIIDNLRADEKGTVDLRTIPNVVFKQEFEEEIESFE